jgi:hypothetical protein
MRMVPAEMLDLMEPRMKKKTAQHHVKMTSIVRHIASAPSLEQQRTLLLPQ